MVADKGFYDIHPFYGAKITKNAIIDLHFHQEIKKR